MALVVVDSDILIDVSRNDRTAIGFVSGLEQNGLVGISSVTAMELIVGSRNKLELAHIQKFLERFLTLQLTEEISERSIELLSSYNLSHGLLIPDALVAATALISDVPFATKNQRDFRFIAELNLLTYP